MEGAKTRRFDSFEIVSWQSLTLRQAAVCYVYKYIKYALEQYNMIQWWL